MLPFIPDNLSLTTLGISKEQIDAMQEKVDTLEIENDAIGLTRVRLDTEGGKAEIIRDERKQA